MSSSRSLLALFAVLLPLIARGSEAVRLALPGLTAVRVPVAEADFYAEQFAQQLSFAGMRVVTRHELTALLGHERQKQLLGSADGSSALELGTLFGADGLVVGSVARIGGALHFTLKVLSTSDATLLSSFSAQVKGEELTLSTLKQGARHVAREVSEKLGRAVPAVALEIDAEQRVTSGPRSFAWIPAVAAGASAVAGGWFLLQANGTHVRLTSAPGEPLPFAEADRLRRDGWTQQALGWTGLGVAAAGAVGAGILFALGGSSSQVQTTVGFMPGGVGLSLGGVW